ncbi:MAG: DNA polymerase-3 subunit gamma/tau [Maribacter sp.]|jgi:DNA polymerase-3 subunit gamma/tau
MSNFIVSARKYRPLRFNDVVGQQHVSQTLKNALKNNHLAHAFLFCGPRGVGKTTCARILAKVLNCQNLDEEQEPCNTCSSCESFNNNASFNIMELDAASNNSVEHIRALIEQVRFQPQQGKYKIFIIDEVHMLSQQAFNAFLKTLEEPPSYAVFILATTEKHKIIPTILSRCQIFDFKRIQIADTVGHLEKICKEENINADKDALHIIAQKADGALRDALSIFDRIVSFSVDKISYQDVITNLNVLDYDYYFKVVDTFLTSDSSELLLVFDDILRKGFDEEVFVNGLAEHIRNLLVCKDERTIQLLEIGESLKAKYKEQAGKTPLSLLLTALDLCNQCDVDFKQARNKRLHVEMALIKMCFINQAVAAHRNPQPVSIEKKTADLSESTPVTYSKPSNPVQKVEEALEEKEIAKKEVAKPKSNAKFVPPSRLISPKFTSLKSIQEEVDGEVKDDGDMVAPTITQIKESWADYLKSVTSPSGKIALKNAILSLKDENTLVITIGTSISEKNLRQEKNLPDHIRKYCKYPPLLIEYKVNIELAPKIDKPEVQKAVTQKEIWQNMVQQNPLVDKLREALDLKPDV